MLHFRLFQNALPRAGRFVTSGRLHAALCWLVLLCFLQPLWAQPLLPTLPRERRGTSRVPRTVPKPLEPQPAFKKFVGRHVVVLMAGVTWQDWAGLAAQTSGTTPGLHRVLTEGDLAALRLPGAPRGEARDEPFDGHGELLAERSALERTRLSPAVLRAAAALSSGQPIGWPANAPQLPLSAAVTLGVTEKWSPGAPGYEEATPALAYARRTGVEPKPDTLVNLAGSLWRGGNTARENGAPHFGALADALRRAGGLSLAYGSGDTNLSSARTLPLREWALLACDGNGVVAGGNLSPALLTADSDAPFGVRQDGTALLSQVQSALDQNAALVVIEWGDTRRAAMYAPLCAPEVATSHKRLALERANEFLRRIMLKLVKEDRLILISVPDLDTPRPQWIPLAYWQPSSSDRAARGGLLSAGGEHQGVAPLESIFTTIMARLEGGQGFLPLDPAPALQPNGTPATATYRVNRLMALQSGWSWLDAARPVAHGIWSVFFLVSMIILVVLLTQSAPAARFGQVLETPTGLLTSSQNWARAWWSATMVLPLLMWLGGLCIEATWRFGALPGGATPGGHGSWRLPLALVLIACFIVGLAGLARTWFSRARLRGVRVGLIYLLLTVVGLFVGGFALPWNSLLGAPVLEGSASRSGDIWSLLLISATLLGIGGMAQPSQRTLAQLAQDSPRLDEYGELDFSPRPSRRIINLRPAALWMIGVLALLWLGSFGRNGGAAFVALLGFGTMWLRLWLERSERPERLRKRRWIVGAAFALGFLLLVPQGAPDLENTLADWWPRWLETWTQWWWNIALLATALGAGAFLTSARVALRNYLRVRYAMRAMLAGAIAAAAAALVIYGSLGPPLIALYTLGAVIFQVLGAPANSAEANA